MSVILGDIGVRDVNIRTFKVIREESCVGGGYKRSGNCTYTIVETANGQEMWYRTSSSYAVGQPIYYVTWTNLFGFTNKGWNDRPIAVSYTHLTLPTKA